MPRSRELAKLAELASALDRRWALAAVARLHGLLGRDDELDEHFGAALELHEQGAGSAVRARTNRAVLGRAAPARRGRRVEHARHLHERGCSASKHSARRRGQRRPRANCAPAAGRARSAEPQARSHELTAQQVQIATMVAEGRTNKSVATSLFLSPKTDRGPPRPRLPQAQHPLPRRTRPALLLRARARDAWCGLVPTEGRERRDSNPRPPA